eukprot:2850156-Amphidinium_carterae.1
MQQQRLSSRKRLGPSRGAIRTRSLYTPITTPRQKPPTIATIIAHTCAGPRRQCDATQWLFYFVLRRKSKHVNMATTQGMHIVSSAMMRS